jgi:hypothetical protein
MQINDSTRTSSLTNDPLEDNSLISFKSNSRKNTE